MQGAPTADDRDIVQLRRDYALSVQFEADLHEVWALVEAHVPAIVRGLLERQAGGGEVSDEAVRQRVDYARAKLNRPVDQLWLDRIVAEADRIAERELDFTVVTASMLVAQMRLHQLFFELTQDPEKLQRLTRAMQKLAVIEVEIIVSRLRSIARARHMAMLREEANAARAELGSSIAEAARASRDVARFTEETAIELQGLSGPAVEVASAADQSAVAMSRSAESAGLLIDAYEAARENAVAAADVAERADAIAKQGAGNAGQLVEHTARIESVVELIAGIARQTRLLALNASIEAARAGESGRGFAIVAQEVRSLADQASSATGSITETIREAQGAAEVVATTNHSILAIVTELIDRVRAVSREMEAQVATVSAILASIDQTAVSSREIAALIATISDRVAALASAAQEAGRQVHAAGDSLARIEETAGQFMQDVVR